MTYSSFTVVCNKSVYISLPVFSDDNEACRRMNRFYSHAAEIIHSYASGLTIDNGRRYRCVFSVIEDENERCAVSLFMTLSTHGKEVKKLRITHVWKDGVIISKDVHRIIF